MGFGLKSDFMLIKKIRVITGNTESAGLQSQDIRINGAGIIEAIGSLSPEPNEVVHEWPHACISPGWLDIGIQTGDPGYEHREHLQSVSAAAAAGGFTAVACFPNTHPALDSKSEILYVLNKTTAEAVTFHPFGAVSEDCAGKDLAELYDMHAAGAVAFSDGNQPVQDAGLLLRALQYASGFNGLIINQPHHKTIAAGGQMHEGVASTMLGLKGLPALAEELMVQRDLSLLEYAGGRLHLHLISTAKSVVLVRAAKRAGLPVTCSVAVANLCFTDEKLTTFNSNWKLLPPLRSTADTEALLEGLVDGTIDFICSNHTPWDEEAKNLEFPYAEFGMIGLETAFSLCRTFLDKKLSVNILVEKMAIQPRRVLGLPIPELTVGSRAELTIFQPDEEWIFEEKNIRSKSRNTPFIGQTLRGSVLGIVNGERVVMQ